MELLSEDLANAAMALDKVELCGRSINVGRPKGYIDPPAGHAAMAPKLGLAQAFAAQLANPPATVLVLENLLRAGELQNDGERKEVRPFPTLFATSSVGIPLFKLSGTQQCLFF